MSVSIDLYNLCGDHPPFRFMEVPCTGIQEVRHFTWLLVVVLWSVSGSCLLGEQIDFCWTRLGTPIEQNMQISFLWKIVINHKLI